MAKDQRGEETVVCVEKGEESYNKKSIDRIFV